MVSVIREKWFAPPHNNAELFNKKKLQFVGFWGGVMFLVSACGGQSNLDSSDGNGSSFTREAALPPRTEADQV